MTATPTLVSPEAIDEGLSPPSPYPDALELVSALHNLPRSSR
jgi:hypothetical protein